MPIPSMTPTSPASTAAFVAIVAAVVAAIVLGTAGAGRRLAEAPALTRRWTLGTAAALLVWLAVTGVVSGSGILAADTLPPRALFFMAGGGSRASTALGPR